jgi:hypothetical protein
MEKNNSHILSTTEKGDIGVFMVSADLIRQGVSIYNPASESSPYDIIVKYEGKYYEVQVKYRAFSQGLNGAIELAPRRTRTKSKGRYLENNYISNKQFDILAVYCPELSKGEDIAYLRPDEYGSSITLRANKPGNNSTKNIRFFKDFLRFERLFEDSDLDHKERLTRLNREGREVGWTITPFRTYSKILEKEVKKFRVASSIKKGVMTKRIDKVASSHRDAMTIINKWEQSESLLKFDKIVGV